jgi:uncharacterized protein YcfL
MKILFILSLFLLVGCGAIDRTVTNWTGTLTYKCSKHGVEYVQSDSGLTVSYNRDGSVVACR